MEGFAPGTLRFTNAAQVRDYDPAAHFDPKDAAMLDRFAQFATIAARDAVHDSCSDIAGATDVSGQASLAGASYKPAAKRLLLNLDKANIGHVDNIEGVSWGPTLSDGNRSLVLVSDNNFNKDEVTQFLAFEVLPQ